MFNMPPPPVPQWLIDKAKVGAAEEEDGWEEVFSGLATKALPELPPECWNETKPDGDRCMAAVRAMCG
jgi:hypothetical protein